MAKKTAEPTPTAERRPAEEWATAKQTAPHIFKATRIGQRWPLGVELTEKQYDDAIHNTLTFPIR